MRRVRGNPIGWLRTVISHFDPPGLEGSQGISFRRMAQLRLLIGLTVISVGDLPGAETNQILAQQIAMSLDTVKERVVTTVTAKLKTNEFTTSYATVWRQIEDAGIEALCEVLPDHVPGLTDRNFDRGIRGREKNRIADLAILCGTNQIEISIKSARAGANPENDMGTFRDYPNRRKMFVASFTLWVRYANADGKIASQKVFFDRTWRFVGKSSLVDGVKYRKKDGNMRPKPWAMFDSGAAYWEDESEFELAVMRAEKFRANELITEYLKALSRSDQQLLYEKLKQQFGESPTREHN